MVAYTLLTKNGPSQEEQLAVIRARVGRIGRGAIYLDDLTASRRPEERHFRDRATMQAQLRPGDTVAIASPGRLGIGRDDVRGMLHAINRSRCSVLDAGAGKRLIWSEEVADAVAFLDRATLEHQAYNLREARARRRALGITKRAGPKPLKVSADEALRIWRDTVRYTEDEAAALIGLSKRQCYTRFRGRLDTDEPSMKRRRRK